MSKPKKKDAAPNVVDEYVAELGAAMSKVTEIIDKAKKDHPEMFRRES
jgi:hypothetical protein